MTITLVLSLYFQGCKSPMPEPDPVPTVREHLTGHRWMLTRDVNVNEFNPTPFENTYSSDSTFFWVFANEGWCQHIHWNERSFFYMWKLVDNDDSLSISVDGGENWYKESIERIDEGHLTLRNKTGQNTYTQYYIADR